MKHAIEVSRLTKTYGSSRGITELDLCVDEGDIFGFIGPNGAGKSTTIRILLGMIKQNSGKARVFGMDTSENRIGILKRIGYMPSEAMFYPGVRVKDMIKLSADIRKKDCSKEAQYLCERFCVDTGRKIEELSLGNRKKVSIVCALQHNPDLLILDEPTSGLDPLMQKEFFDVLNERNEKGATIFFSSHVLSEIQHNCANAAIIREGKLILQDSIDNLSAANARRVTVHGIKTLPELSGISDINESSKGISFLFSGDINMLVSALAEYKLSDLSICEPDIEEIFMHYYQKEDE
ncbi:MAG: ABC transporter ATP-binding protein [Oscillospiraceae bacterium]|nr:ABC transporter ATP-binding protein [Oscillospiraceae bacterium]